MESHINNQREATKRFIMERVESLYHARGELNIKWAKEDLLRGIEKLIKINNYTDDKNMEFERYMSETKKEIKPIIVFKCEEHENCDLVPGEKERKNRNGEIKSLLNGNSIRNFNSDRITEFTDRSC